MLTDLVATDFQSVEYAKLRLGRFTVITGPTGSGKSAVLRAFRLAAFNQRGTGFIRQGAKSATVGFGSQDEGWFLAIERGGRGKDAYRIAWLRGDTELPELRAADVPETVVQTFTKLGGEAPPEVLDVHRLGELNFAGQHDAPFLLTESGAEVARVLGELTRVTLVYEAAREGARRRQRIAAELKAAESDAVRLASQLQQYAGLPGCRAAQERAEQYLGRAQEAWLAVQRLRQLGEQAVQAAGDVRAAGERSAAAAPPSLEAVEALFSQRVTISVLIHEAETAQDEIRMWTTRLPDLDSAVDAAHQAVHNALEEMGTCPTCGQVVGQP